MDWDCSRVAYAYIGPSVDTVLALPPPLIVAAFASVWQNKMKTGLLALLSFHIHLFKDMLASGGSDGSVGHPT